MRRGSLLCGGVSFWRGCVMINLNRGDKQYTDVENFKKYELTHCIAYEMAIRNDEVIKTVEAFVKGYIKEYANQYKIVPLSTLDYPNTIALYSQKLLNHMINPLQLHLEYHFFNDINKIISDIKIESEDGVLFNEGTDFLFFPSKPREYNREHHVDNYDYKTQLKITEHCIVYTIHRYDTVEKWSTIMNRSLEPIYSRPLNIDEREAKYRNIKLNMALPTKELEDFIKKAKEEYNSNQNDFLSIEELLNGVSEKENIKLPQKRYADLLFCYDCHKLGYTQAKIQNKIDRYYEDKDPSSTTISTNTIKNYIKTAKQFIDNEKYKHLVT